MQARTHARTHTHTHTHILVVAGCSWLCCACRDLAFLCAFAEQGPRWCPHVVRILARFTSGMFDQLCATPTSPYSCSSIAHCPAIRSSLLATPFSNSHHLTSMVGAQIAKEVGLTYRVGETDHPENNLISKIRSGWPSRSAWPFVVHRECSANRNWEEAS